MLLGLLLWYAFYFVDRFWYHPLLKSAVDHGTILEDEIKKSLPGSGMTAAISAGSPQKVGKVVAVISRKQEMHSSDKLIWFYSVGAAAFILAAIALQAGAMTMAGPSSPPPVKVQIEGNSVVATPSGILVQPTPGGSRPAPSSPLPATSP